MENHCKYGDIGNSLGYLESEKQEDVLGKGRSLGRVLEDHNHSIALW